MKIAASFAFRVSSTEFVELSEIERFEDGSGFVSRIRVGSGEFACFGRKFYFDDLPRFQRELAKAYRDVRGSAELRQRYESEFVRFEFTARGHVVVSGVLMDYGHLERKLHFAFEADQSFVPPFLAEIAAALVECG